MLRSRRTVGWISAFLVPLMAGLLVIAPLARAAEDADACTAAQTAAKANTSGGLWFVAGCLGGVIGLICSYAIVPNPPATALLGKSPEYVAKYTDCYREAAKGVQSRMAWTGCGIAAVGYVIYIIVVVAAVSSTTTTTI